MFHDSLVPFAERQIIMMKIMTNRLDRGFYLYQEEDPLFYENTAEKP